MFFMTFARLQHRVRPVMQVLISVDRGEHVVRAERPMVLFFFDNVVTGLDDVVHDVCKFVTQS